MGSIKHNIKYFHEVHAQLYLLEEALLHYSSGRTRLLAAVMVGQHHGSQ